MRVAGTIDGVVRATGASLGVNEEIRCPSCTRLLVLRTGPAIRPHFAHRPRQSCRNRAGHAVAPLRLEQLTLFDLEPPVLATPGDPIVILEAGLVYPPAAPALTPVEVAARKHRRRKRRAWLPRLIRRLRGTRTGRVRGPAPSSAFTPETRGDAGPRI